MRSILIGLGGGLLLALAIWIALDFAPPGAVFEVVGRGFTEPSFSGQANAALTQAEAARDAAVAEFRFWNFIGRITAWIALGASATVTLLTGIFGKDSANKVSGRAHLFHVLGGLGALASVATLMGTHAKETSQGAHADAVELSRVIRRTAETLKAAPEQEALLLSELDAATRLMRR